jgi:hypothetical protein
MMGGDRRSGGEPAGCAPVRVAVGRLAENRRRPRNCLPVFGHSPACTRDIHTVQVLNLGTSISKLRTYLKKSYVDFAYLARGQHPGTAGRCRRVEVV